MNHQTLANQSISSMNYFYLRVATGAELNPIVLAELRTFLTHIEQEQFRLPTDVLIKIRSEILEGGYFSGKTRDEIKTLLTEANQQITGEMRPNVTAFYLRCMTLIDVNAS